MTLVKLKIVQNVKISGLKKSMAKVFELHLLK